MSGLIPAVALLAAVATPPAVPLPPTLVELRVADAPLAEVLADLEKQAGFPVHVAEAPDAGKRKVTVDTGGKVPFWEAAEQVAKAARMHADAIPPHGGGWYLFANDLPRDRLLTVARGATTDTLTKMLTIGSEGESDLRNRHGGAVVFRPGRPAVTPASVRGAVRVRPTVLPAMPAVAADTVPVILHVACEPGRLWKQVTSVEITRATAADGREFVAKPAAGEVVVYPVEVPEGAVAAVGGRGEKTQTGSTVFPAPAHVLARLTVPPDNAPKRLKALEGEVRGVVWGPPEELASAVVGKPGAVNRTTGRYGIGVEVLHVGPAVDTDPVGLIVVLTYHPGQVLPPGANPWPFFEAGMDGRDREGVELSDVIDPKNRPAPVREFRGLAVADADGNPFDIAVLANKYRLSGSNGRSEHTQVIDLTLVPTVDGQKPPATVRFRGSRTATVRVPFTLADVPVSAGAGQ